MTDNDIHGSSSLFVRQCRWIAGDARPHKPNAFLLEKSPFSQRAVRCIIPSLQFPTPSILAPVSSLSSMHPLQLLPWPTQLALSWPVKETFSTGKGLVQGISYTRLPHAMEVQGAGTLFPALPFAFERCCTSCITFPTLSFPPTIECNKAIGSRQLKWDTILSIFLFAINPSDFLFHFGPILHFKFVGKSGRELNRFGSIPEPFSPSRYWAYSTSKIQEKPKVWLHGEPKQFNKHVQASWGCRCSSNGCLLWSKLF